MGMNKCFSYTYSSKSSCHSSRFLYIAAIFLRHFDIIKQFVFTQTITNNQFYSGGSTRIFVWRPLYVSNTRVGDSMRTFLSFLSSLWNTFGGQINKYIEIIGSLYCLCSKIRGFAPQRDFYLNKLPL